MKPQFTQSAVSFRICRTIYCCQARLQKCLQLQKREEILRRVADMAPDLYKYVCHAYATETSLAFGSFEIVSKEGVQQGDPLGPLLFCLCLHPIITNLQCDLRIGYMDDVTLGGHISDVSMTIEIINREGSSIGLKLNPTKCEVVGYK